MSCCGNHNHKNHQNGNHGQHGGNHKSHKWLMMIFCVLPIALAAVFFLTKGTEGAVSSYLPFFLILLCPLSHLILMPLMHKKDKDDQSKL